MAQLEPFVGELEKREVSLVYVAAEKREGMFKPMSFLEEHPVSYPFLLDEDRSVTKAYGVYHRLGFDAINIARPATFVVGKDGILKFQYVGENQTDRVDFAEAIQALDQLQAGR